KSLIRQAQIHLAAQRTRRDTIIRQSRADIAQLLQHGLSQQVLNRIEQLHKDQCLLSTYDQINELCQYILANMSQISQHSDPLCLPVNVGQAVSSIIYAASRCGELPELHMIRNLFRQRYGSKFDTTNVELLPGNLVDSRIKERLSVNSATDGMKLHLINDIAAQYNLDLGFQDFVPTPGFQWQEKAEVMDLAIQDICSDSDESSIPASEFKTPPKVRSCYSYSGGGNPESLRNQSKIKGNEVLLKNSEPSSTRSSSATPAIRETSVVYLDDMEGSYSSKAPKGLSNSSDVSSSSSSYKAERPSVSKKGAPLSMGVASIAKQKEMAAKDRFSFDSSINKLKAQNGSSSTSSHVHPKLPNYEDVVAELTDIKT
ncbi:hypothetical protein Tsubulata_005682, partial [Turnera subulata]